MFAPAATPQAVVGRLREEIVKALALPEVKEKLNAAGGLQPLRLAPAEFSALIQRDSAKFEKIVRQIGVTID